MLYQCENYILLTEESLGKVNDTIDVLKFVWAG